MDSGLGSLDPAIAAENGFAASRILIAITILKWSVL